MEYFEAPAKTFLARRYTDKYEDGLAAKAEQDEPRLLSREGEKGTRAFVSHDSVVLLRLAYNGAE